MWGPYLLLIPVQECGTEWSRGAWGPTQLVEVLWGAI